MKFNDYFQIYKLSKNNFFIRHPQPYPTPIYIQNNHAISLKPSRQAQKFSTRHLKISPIKNLEPKVESTKIK